MRSAIRRTLSATALVTALVVALGACGDGADTATDPASGSSSPSTAPSSESPSQSPSPSEQSSSSTPPSGPGCESVWKEGAKLPRGYDGCVQTDQFVKRDVLNCSSGQRIIRYDDHYYAALGGKIYQTKSVLMQDRGYRDAVAVCRG